MNTLYFKYAVEVERTGSITQAANNLFMAQPNISKAIKELEDSLGINIFARTSKGVVPTKKGAEFLRYAKKILSELEKMEALSLPRDIETQSFNISIPRGSYIASSVTSFLAGLDFNKGIDINIQETNSMQAISNILDNNFNLGIIRYQISYENYFLDYLKEKKLSYEAIWDFEYLALMSENHLLANADAITSKELINYTELVHGDNFIPYINEIEIKKAQRESWGEKRIYVYERASQFDILSKIPSTFMWVSPIPDKLLKSYGLVQRKCSQINCTHINNLPSALTNHISSKPINCANSSHRLKDMLIYPRNYKLSKLDKDFIDKLFLSRNEVAFEKYL